MVSSVNTAGSALNYVKSNALGPKPGYGPFQCRIENRLPKFPHYVTVNCISVSLHNNRIQVF